MILVRRNPSAHSQRLEQWLGKDRVEGISKSMLGWYGRPIALLDCPGGVKVHSDGDYTGPFERGYAASAMDALEAAIKRAWHAPHGQLNAGFTSISDALARASGGFSQRRHFNKIGPTGVVGVTSSLWRVGPQPAVGDAPGNAPGGTAFSSSSTGALAFANPAAGSNRLIGADVASSVVSHSLLLFDLLFGVNKTMNSIAVELVTGVPTRYQSSVSTDEDYAGDNFLFVQVGGTALAATAHTWGVAGSPSEFIGYRNQAGVDLQDMPVLTGNASAIVDRLDHPAQQWFAPLNTGDVGIMDLARLKCSAAVATGVVWFMIGHPLGFMSFPVINSVLPFDWLTNRDQAPRVFNSACPAFLEITKPATTATTYCGRIVTTSTAS